MAPRSGKWSRGEIDEPTRERIRGWIRYEMHKRQIESIRQFSGLVGVSHAYMARVLNSGQTPGLEMVLRLHRKLHISLDTLCDVDPPVMR